MARLDPDSIPNFILIRLIDSGAYGEVWLARDSFIGVHRAIKVIWFEPDSPTPTDPKRDHRADAEKVFRGLEAYLKRFRSGRPPAIPILAVHRHPSGRFFYYVMPLADDATAPDSSGTPGFDSYQPLNLDVLRRRQPNQRLAPDVVVRIGARLASGLIELHAVGLVHRDIKPSNIVFLNGEPVIADIDLVRDVEAPQTIAGTEGYIPREGAGRPAADVYSLVVTLYVLLTGNSALKFPDLSADWRSIAKDRLALELNEVFNRGGHNNPDRRYPDATRLREDLLLLEAGQSLTRIRRLERVGKWSLRVAAVAVPVAIIGTWVAWKLQTSEKVAQFELYRSGLARADNSIYQNRSGEARDHLNSASLTGITPGPEWTLLHHQAQGDPSRLLQRFPTGIAHLSFNPSGTSLAILTDDDTLNIADTSSWVVAFTIPYVRALGGWLDDARIAGSSGTDFKANPVCVWNTTNGERSAITWPGRNRMITGLIDERRAGFLDLNKAGWLCLWEAGTTKQPVWHQWGEVSTNARTRGRYIDATGKTFLHVATEGEADGFTAYVHLQHLANPTPSSPIQLGMVEPTAVALSPSGNAWAYANPRNGELILRRIDNSSQPVTNSFGSLRTLQFSPDGNWLASGGEDEVLRIHSVQDLRVRRSLMGHTSEIKQLTWDSAGSRIASADAKGEVLIWDLANRPIITDVTQGFKQGGRNPTLTPSPDGKLLAAPGNHSDIHVVDAATLQIRRTLQSASMPIHFAKEGLWALNSTNQLVRLDPESGSRESEFSIVGFDTAPAGLATPDGTHALLYTRHQFAVTEMPPKDPIQVHSTKDLSENAMLHDAAVSPDGKHFAAILDRFGIILWKTADPTKPDVREIEGIQPTSIRFLDNQTLLLGDEGKIHLMRITDPAPHQTFDSPLTNNDDLLAMPESDRLVTTGAGGRMGFIRLSDGVTLAALFHRSLRQIPGEHTVRRIHRLANGDIIGLTDNGLLVAWRTGR